MGIDEFFTRTDGVGTRGLLPDALGSTVALGDNTGTLQTQYTYEPFGYATQTGQASASSYKYTGREDDGSGLYYYRARYYHPRLQRFISEDPIGFRGRDANLYGYVSNRPTNWTDWNGTGPIGTAGMIACAAYDIYDFYSTSQDLAQLADEIKALSDRIDTLDKICKSGKGSDQDLERLRVLQYEVLNKVGGFNRKQIKDYAKNIAIGFGCAAIGALPF